MTKDEALKMAIKEMTDAIPHLDIHFDDYFEAINACKEALEQPAQEPMAWMNDEGFGLYPTNDTAIPLYTYPHQWQGLTDDEIVAKVFENDELLARILYLDGVSKALKQALEEKNHGI
jgi:hypothetical protein